MAEYFTSQQHLVNVYDQLSQKYAFRAENLFEFKLWKKMFWTELADIIGINKMIYADLKPEILKVEEQDGFIRKKVVIQTEPNVLMPFYILIPNNLQKDEKRPAIIATHGHGCGGKYAIAGRTDIPIIKEIIEKSNCDYGVQLVKRGYIVFCPDARGFGERREIMDQGDTTEKLLSSSCNDLNNLAITLGQSLTGMWVWDLMRLVDFIQTYQCIDPNRIGVCGFSGGGLQALWLAVMDERIKAAIVAGYFHGFKDTIFQSNMCGCNFIPDIWSCCDMGDLGAMIAPRFLMVKSGNEDELNGSSGINNVFSQVDTTSKAYKLLDREENFCHHVFKGGHMWNKEGIGHFLDNAFKY